jgi:hypothetical protein
MAVVPMYGMTLRRMVLLVSPLVFLVAGTLLFPLIMEVFGRFRATQMTDSGALMLRLMLILSALWAVGVTLWLSNGGERGQDAIGANARWGAVILVLYVFITLASLRWNFGVPHDFCAYRVAGELSLSGDWDALYDESRYGNCGYPFVYPPLVALLFWPSAYLSPTVAATCYLILQLIAAVLALRWAFEAGAPERDHSNVWYSVLPWLSFLPLFHELNVGNVTAFELFAIAWMLRPGPNQPLLALGKGVVVAILGSAKLYACVISLLLCIVRRKKWEAAGILGTGAIELAVSLLFLQAPFQAWQELTHRLAEQGGSLLAIINAAIPLAKLIGTTPAWALEELVITVVFAFAALRFARQCGSIEQRQAVLSILAIIYVFLSFPRWNTYSYALAVIVLFASRKLLTAPVFRALSLSAWFLLGLGGAAGLSVYLLTMFHVLFVRYYALTTSLWFIAIAVIILGAQSRAAVDVPAAAQQSGLPLR